MAFSINKIITTIREFSISHHAHQVEKLYEKYEYRFGPLAMLIGIIFDFLAFRRIDLLFENLVLVGYLIIGATGITLVNLYEGGVVKGKFFDRMRMWLPLLIQFSFGGLFSAFVVFYVKSASLVTSWPFFVLLIALLVGNEFFRKRYVRLTFHMSIYFLALYSFSIFYLPIVVKSISPAIFILSGVVSLLLIIAFIFLLSKAIPKRIKEARQSLVWSIRTIFILINLLYFANIIPPIPLALKEGGVYHSVTRTNGLYHAVAEEKKWYELFTRERIHVIPGNPVYVFSAVFAPTDLRTPVAHHWQYQDEQTKEWITADKIEYPILGGRDGGYRGYSFKYYTFPGDWRVDIETENGQVIGRVSFTIEETDTPPEVKEKVF